MSRSPTFPVSGPVSVLVSVAVAVTVSLAVTTRATPSPEPLRYPSPPRAEVRETLHGVEVVDPYRPLEALEAPETRAWIAAEDALTRRLLDADPGFERRRRRLEALTATPATGVPVAAGGRLFYLHAEATKSRASILVRGEDDAATASPRLLVDVEVLPADHRLRGPWPSPDGRLLAYGVGPAASRRFELRFVDVASGRLLEDRLSGLSSLAGPAWSADGSGVYYARYAPPPSGEDAATAALEGYRLLFHRLGSPPDGDRLVFETPEHPEWTFAPTVTADGRHLVVTVSTGSGPNTRLYAQDLGDPASTPRPLLPEVEAASGFLAEEGGKVWIQTTIGAPKSRVVRLDLADPAPERWVEVVPEREDTIYFANAVAGRLVTVTLRDARHVVEVFSLDGRLEREVPLPDLGTTFSGFVGRLADRFAYFSFNSLAYPGSSSVFRLDPRSGATTSFGDASLPYDPSLYVTEQVFFRSKDGTRVPMFVAHRRDVRADGTRPVFLYAYGAFGWAALPWYQPQVLAWMEEGGVYALANVRGGGEYGESWYQAGVGARKQNAVDDYLAAAEWLVAARWAAPGKLVANGGSASGGIAALAMVQRPELFGAVVVDIPITDSVRYDRFTGGARWRSELGDPADPADFPWLLATSPLHVLRPGVCYPPTLVTAGEKDETAPPLHAYKWVAALQAAQACDRPALLQVVWGGGHGFGSTREQSAETYARMLVFLERSLASEPAPVAP